MSEIYFIYLALALFFIGACGVLMKRNAVSLFMCIELMMNAANLVFVAAASSRGDVIGQVAVFFVMVVAAVEVAVGLAITLSVFGLKKSTDVESLSDLG